MIINVMIRKHEFLNHESMNVFFWWDAVFNFLIPNPKFQFPKAKLLLTIQPYFLWFVKLFCLIEWLILQSYNEEHEHEQGSWLCTLLSLSMLLVLVLLLLLLSLSFSFIMLLVSELRWVIIVSGMVVLSHL